MTPPDSNLTSGAGFQVLHPSAIHRVELAMADLREGRMVILVDDEDRENEGDLVIAAEKITPEAINFMARFACGLICLSITSEQVQRLGLPMMVSNNQSPYGTAFTVSIEARHGVSTGISAADRAHTVQVAIDPKATPRDLVTPGHMFPLRARDGGVLERVGQTEGSVDLARMAGLRPSAVICEVMKHDGTMARMPDLEVFGREHGIRIVTVADVIEYRMRNERIVRHEADGTMEIPGVGTWQTRLYRSLVNGGLHLALVKGTVGPEATLVRVQAAPPPWSFLGTAQGGMARSARAALEAVAEEGRGVVVFMHLAGSPDFLHHQFVKDFGGERDAPQQARADALRDLGTGCQILVDLGLRDLRLVLNSDRPIVGVEAYGLQVIERVDVRPDVD